MRFRWNEGTQLAELLHEMMDYMLALTQYEMEDSRPEAGWKRELPSADIFLAKAFEIALRLGATEETVRSVWQETLEFEDRFPYLADYRKKHLNM